MRRALALPRAAPELAGDKLSRADAWLRPRVRPMPLFPCTLRHGRSAPDPKTPHAPDESDCHAGGRRRRPAVKSLPGIAPAIASISAGRQIFFVFLGVEPRDGTARSATPCASRLPSSPVEA